MLVASSARPLRSFWQRSPQNNGAHFAQPYSAASYNCDRRCRQMPLQRAWLRARAQWAQWARWARSRRLVLALALATLALAALLPAQVALRSSARFPRVAPRRLAHLLADFSYHPRLYPHMGEWAVLDESSNGSAWRYAVAYECGLRCAGRAQVLALDGAGARAHRVLVQHRTCAPLPALPWPIFCDEWETETMVTGADDGETAWLEERASAKCGWWSALSGACSRRLRENRDAHFRRLDALLSNSPSPAPSTLQ